LQPASPSPVFGFSISTAVQRMVLGTRFAVARDRTHLPVCHASCLQGRNPLAWCMEPLDALAVLFWLDRSQTGTTRCKVLNPFRRAD
jgi:hypothetical protein